MTEFREWDWPPYPERHRAGRRASQPVLDLHVQVTRGAAGDRKRSLRDRIMAGYLRVMVAAAKIIVGAVGGLVVALAIWFIVTLLTLPKP
jgi:hypothetical protein